MTCVGGVVLLLAIKQIPAELITLDPDTIRKVNPKQDEDESTKVKTISGYCIYGVYFVLYNN